MGADFSWSESNGVGEDVTSLGSVGSTILGWAYKTVDSSGTQDFAANPITAGANSFEKYLRGDFQGTFNTVNNLKIWRSAGSLGAFGVIDLYSGTGAYATPGTADSSKATVIIGTASPAATNVGGSLTGTGFSGYNILQARASTSAPSGNSGTSRVSLSFDET